MACKKFQQEFSISFEKEFWQQPYHWPIRHNEEICEDEIRFVIKILTKNLYRCEGERKLKNYFTKTLEHFAIEKILSIIQPYILIKITIPSHARCYCPYGSDVARFISFNLSLLHRKISLSNLPDLSPRMKIAASRYYEKFVTNNFFQILEHVFREIYQKNFHLKFAVFSSSAFISHRVGVLMFTRPKNHSMIFYAFKVDEKYFCVAFRSIQREPTSLLYSSVLQTLYSRLFVHHI